MFIVSDDGHRLLVLTVQIVTAYLEAHGVDAAAMPHLIRSVYQVLASLEHDAPMVVGPSRSTVPPAVDPKRSVFPDYLICLEDGKQLTTLTRHLRTVHGLTPQAYRAKWGLPEHYPMAAPNYAKLRSRLAKESRLGRKR
jgi:predicted transcriptional regulator